MVTESHYQSLLEKSIQGDSEAYREFLEIISQWTFRFLNRYSLNEFDRDDLIQEVLLAIHKALPTFLASGSVKSWIFSIIRFKLMDFFRKKYKHKTESIDDLEFMIDACAHVPDHQNELEIWDYLDQALQKLPDTQHQIIRMLKIDCYPIAEVARRLDMTPGAVKTTASRAYKRLRDIMANMERRDS
jgi:RNA polymerase sigma-70 factor (ECF subfamily)